MTEQRKAAAYIRVANAYQLSGDRQRDELLAKFDDTHQIVGEYRDMARGSRGVGDRPALEKLLEDAAKGEFDVLLCMDLTRLTRQVTPEIIRALKKAGVRVVTADGSEVCIADLVAHTLLSQSAKTYSAWMSERIKQGIRASKSASAKKRRTKK